MGQSGDNRSCVRFHDDALLKSGPFNRRPRGERRFSHLYEQMSSFPITCLPECHMDLEPTHRNEKISTRFSTERRGRRGDRGVEWDPYWSDDRVDVSVFDSRGQRQAVLAQRDSFVDNLHGQEPVMPRSTLNACLLRRSPAARCVVRQRSRRWRWPAWPGWLAGWVCLRGPARRRWCAVDIQRNICAPSSPMNISRGIAAVKKSETRASTQTNRHRWARR